MSKPLGPSALAALRENEEITVTAQRWQFDILLRGATDRLRELTRQRDNAIHPVEASQINQIIDCYEAILTDIGGDLGHVLRTISFTQEPGLQRYPLSFTEEELEEGIAAKRPASDEATPVPSDVPISSPSVSYPDDRRTEERRTHTDLTFGGEEKRSGQDRREPATV